MQSGSKMVKVNNTKLSNIRDIILFRSAEKLPEDQFVLNCILHFHEGQNTMTLLKKHKKVRPSKNKQKVMFLVPAC